MARKNVTNRMIATALTAKGVDPEQATTMNIQEAYDRLREEVGNPSPEVSMWWRGGDSIFLSQDRQDAILALMTPAKK